MLAKTARFAPGVCAVLILQLTCLSFAGVPAELEQAEALLEKGQYQQAEAIYQQVATAYPGTDYAFGHKRALPSRMSDGASWRRQKQLLSN
jgi:hypothetical protein